MPIIKPDVTESSAFVLEAGTYPGKLVSHDAMVSKAGNPMLVFDTEVNTPDGKVINRTLRVVTSGKGSFQFIDLLRACHLNDDANRFVQGSNDEFNSDVLNGQEVLFTIEQTTYQDRLQDQITKVLPR